MHLCSGVKLKMKSTISAFYIKTLRGRNIHFETVYNICDKTASSQKEAGSICHHIVSVTFIRGDVFIGLLHNGLRRTEERNRAHTNTHAHGLDGSLKALVWALKTCTEGRCERCQPRSPHTCPRHFSIAQQCFSRGHTGHRAGICFTCALLEVRTAHFILGHQSAASHWQKTTEHVSWLSAAPLRLWLWKSPCCSASLQNISSFAPSRTTFPRNPPRLVVVVVFVSTSSQVEVTEQTWKWPPQAMLSRSLSSP